MYSADEGHAEERAYFDEARAMGRAQTNKTYANQLKLKDWREDRMHLAIYVKRRFGFDARCAGKSATDYAGKSCTMFK
jgi:hypothetical protein